MMVMVFDEGVSVGNLRSIEQFVVHIGVMMRRMMVVVESGGILVNGIDYQNFTQPRNCMYLPDRED